MTAVANAWCDYDQDVSDAWKSFVDGDAAAFQTYGQTTATAAQTAANNIASQNVSRVSNIASELTTYNSSTAPALKSFKQSVWGAMTPWMTSVAAAEKTATDNSAGAAKSYETSLFAEVHDLGDDFATAADDFVDHVLGDWLPYAQSVASAVAGAAHGGAGALNALLTSLRTAGTTQAQDDRTSWKSYKLGIVGNEDGLMSAYAADLKAQGVVSAVTNYDTIAATPLADFQFQIGQQTTAMPMGMGVMRPTTDDDYINWGNGIAGAVNPPAPTPPTVDAQQLIRQIEEAAKPQNTVMMPIGSATHFPISENISKLGTISHGAVRPEVAFLNMLRENPMLAAGIPPYADSRAMLQADALRIHGGTIPADVRTVIEMCQNDSLCMDAIRGLLNQIARTPDRGFYYPERDKCFQWLGEFLTNYPLYNGTPPTISLAAGRVTLEPLEVPTRYGSWIITARNIIGLDRGRMNSHGLVRVTIQPRNGVSVTAYFDLGASTNQGHYGGTDHFFFDRTSGFLLELDLTLARPFIP